MRALLLFIFLLGAGATAYLTHGTHWQLPPHLNPWAPLVIEEPPNWLTRHKLRRLDDDPQACLLTLEQARMRAEPLPDREAAPGCPLRNVVLVRETRVQVGTPFTLSCRAAVSLALWEEHVMVPEAERLLGTSVRQIDHFGSFACRNVYGREGGRLSQHASADALDIAGFRLQDGRRITVSGHWRSEGAEGSERPEAQFLRAVHRGACQFFDGVFGPEYNQAHADHLHLDRGPFTLCR
ncbi:MAG: extensin family protein [Hydrogenophaga sp.]|nr:extensin family protein [Hydrogenophaga sp.]